MRARPCRWFFCAVRTAPGRAAVLVVTAISLRDSGPEAGATGLWAPGLFSLVVGVTAQGAFGQILRGWGWPGPNLVTSLSVGSGRVGPELTCATDPLVPGQAGHGAEYYHDADRDQV